MKNQNTFIFVLLVLFNYLTGISQEKPDYKQRYEAIEKALKQKENRNSILSADLNNLIQKKEAINSDLYITKNNEISIIARCKSNVTALANELEELGANDIKTYKHTVTFKLSIDKVQELNKCIELKHAKLELKPIKNNGKVTSEAFKSLKVNRVLNQYGLTGKNVKIGVISDSYNARSGESKGIITGDLPGANNPNGFTKPVKVLSEIDSFDEGDDEGRAMIELIHDLAPEAEILFYSGFNGYFDFADGIIALADAGADIIVDDLSYFTEPFFQNGAIAQAVNKVVDQGVVYFSSAGNYGEQSYESNYRNVVRENLNFHDFNPGPNADGFQRILLEANSTFTISLQWDQPSPFYTDGDGAADSRLKTDLDIFIFDPATNEIVFQSADTNSDSSVEVIRLSTNDEPVIFDLAIVKSSGPNPKRVKWVNFGDDPAVTEYDTNSSTIVGHANAQKAIALGAVSFFRVKGFNGRETTSVNGFSSKGGTFLRLNNNGSRKTKPLNTKKPDFCATDGVNTTFFLNDIPDVVQGVELENDTNPNFFGTSAAAPHAAAIASLLLQANPDLKPNQIRNILKNTADDMDNPLTNNFAKGYDKKTGFGYINARKAVVQSIKNAGIKNLNLTSVCSNNPDVRLKWRVRNPNPFNVNYTYQVIGTNQRNTKVAKPGDTFFTTTRVASGSNTTKITWKDEENNLEQVIKASGFATCNNFSNTNFSDLSNIKEKLTTYPNPIVSQNIIVSYSSNSSKKETLRVIPIHSMNLVPVIETPIEIRRGNNEIALNLASLKKGIYILQIGSETKKIIKQ